MNSHEDGPGRAGGPRRLNYAGVYAAIVGLGILIGSLGSWAFPHDWGPDDWIALSVGVFTTMAVAVVAQRQDDIRVAADRRHKASQDAFASLDFQEKLGVIEANAYRTSGIDPDWCMYVASDARAAMYVFEYVDWDQQMNYLNAVGTAFRNMNTHFPRVLEEAARTSRQSELKGTIRIDVTHLLKRLDQLTARDLMGSGNDALIGTRNEVRRFDERYLSDATNRTFAGELALGDIDFAAFEALFRSNIRVLFNWEAARRLSPNVTMSIVGHDGGEVLEELFTPWYETDVEDGAYSMGFPCLRVGELRSARMAFSTGRVRAVDKIGRSLGSGTPSMQTIAVYNFGSGRLVLDGNHRLASMAFQGRWSPVHIIEVAGPRKSPDGAFIQADLRNVPGL